MRRKCVPAPFHFHSCSCSLSAPPTQPLWVHHSWKAQLKVLASWESVPIPNTMSSSPPWLAVAHVNIFPMAEHHGLFQYLSVIDHLHLCHIPFITCHTRQVGPHLTYSSISQSPLDGGSLTQYLMESLNSPNFLKPRDLLLLRAYQPPLPPPLPLPSLRPSQWDINKHPGHCLLYLSLQTLD